MPFLNNEPYELEEIDKCLMASINTIAVVSHGLSFPTEGHFLSRFVKGFLKAPKEQFLVPLQLGKNQWVGLRFCFNPRRQLVIQYIDPQGKSAPDILKTFLAQMCSHQFQEVRTKLQHYTPVKTTNNHGAAFLIFALSSLANKELELDKDGTLLLNKHRIRNLNYLESKQLGQSLRMHHFNLMNRPLDKNGEKNNKEKKKALQLLTQIQLQPHLNLAITHDMTHEAVGNKLANRRNPTPGQHFKPEVEAVGNLVIAYVELDLYLSHPIGATSLTIPINTGHSYFNSSNNRALSLSLKDSYTEDKPIAGTGKLNQTHYHSEPLLFQFLKSKESLEYIEKKVQEFLSPVDKPKPGQNQNMSLLSIDHVTVHFHTTQSMCTACQNVSQEDGNHVGFARNYANRFNRYFQKMVPTLATTVSFNPSYTQAHKTEQVVLHTSPEALATAPITSPQQHSIQAAQRNKPSQSRAAVMDYMNSNGTFNFAKNPFTCFHNKGSDNNSKYALSTLNHATVMGSQVEAIAHRAASKIKGAFRVFSLKKKAKENAETRVEAPEKGNTNTAAAAPKI